METPWKQRVVLALVSVTAMLAVYALVSNAYRFLDPSLLPHAVARLLRPEILPPTQGVVEALASLVTGKPLAAGDGLAVELGGVAAAARVAELMGAELGWDGARVRAEAARYAEFAAR